MRQTLFSCVGVLLLSISAFAGDEVGKLTVDKARLRDLLDLPSIHVQVSTGYITVGGATLLDAEGAQQRIQLLKSQLDGSANDAERYVELSNLHVKLKDKDGSRAAARKALELLHPRLVNEPGSGKLHALHAQALQANGQPAEACRAAELAVKLAPQAALHWQALGNVRMAEALVTLLGGWERALQFENRESAEVLAELNARRSEANLIAQAEAHILEAYRCFEKAATLTPQDAELQRTRVAWRLMECSWRMALEQEDRLASALGAVASDVGQLAKLCPDDPEVHALRASVLSMKLISSRQWDNELIRRVSWFETLPEDHEKQTIHQCLAKLEQLMTAKESKVAAASARNLSALHVMLGDWTKVEKYARRAIDLKCDRLEAWDILDAALSVRVECTIKAVTAFLAVAGSDSWFRIGRYCIEKGFKAHVRVEIVDQCREKLQRFPSARNHFCLAQSCYHAFQDTAALREFREAAKQYPGDLHCQLGLAAHIMMQNKTPPDLNEAGKAILRAHELSKENKNPQLMRDYAFISAIYFALAGEATRSREGLESLQRQLPEDADVRKALALFRDNR